VPDAKDIADAMSRTDYTLTGFLLVFICAIFVCAGLSVWWVANRVMLPGLERFFGHLDAVDKTMRGFDETLQKLPPQIEKLAEHAEETNKRIEHIESYVITRVARSSE
jgi:hypothetical protein